MSPSVRIIVRRADMSAEASVKPKRRPGQDAEHFKTDKSGRLVIAESDSDKGDADDAGGAFVGAQRGVDGQTRTASGIVKFARGTKRAKEEEMEMDDEPKQQKGRRDDVVEKRKKMSKARLGDEFRAKVSSKKLEIWTAWLTLIARRRRYQTCWRA